MWVLMFIIILPGGFSSQVRFEQVQMANQAACTRAGEEIKNNSSGFAIMCVSSETGEIVRIREGR